MMSVKPVSTNDLFMAARGAGHPTNRAHVAAALLYWSQHAQGQDGIFYKEDSDLAEALGRHRKTVGKAVCDLCRAGDGNALFHLTYGPKPGAQWGRVRWLTILPAGESLIAAAREIESSRQNKKREKKAMRGERKAATDGSRSLPSEAVDCGHRSPRNAPTKNHTDFNAPSNAQSNVLSLKPRESKTGFERKEELQEGVKRLVSLWETACVRTGRTDLIWTNAEIFRQRAEVEAAVRTTDIQRLPDAEVLDRLMLICAEISRFRQIMSERFMAVNEGGISLKSFAMWARELFSFAGRELQTQQAAKTYG